MQSSTSTADGSEPTELSEDDYETLCSLSQDGKLQELQSFVAVWESKSGRKLLAKSLCPDSRLKKPSPLVLAAQMGRLDVVSYLLDRFGPSLEIDHSSTIVSLTTKKKVHCATALWAASTGGHLEVVRLLVGRGAAVNKPTLTQSTPLRGASFHGHLDVIEYLLSKGANINLPNCIGQSPVCIAAMRGKLEAVQYLIRNGAELSQKTINGYTVLHLSAAKGRLDIVKFLLSIGFPPLFSEADSSQENYIPCPLFLAASTGQKRVVEELAGHPSCQPSCVADAYLLLGSTRCEISIRGLTMGSLSLWQKGLEWKEKHGVKTSFLAPVQEYENVTEIESLQDLLQLYSDPNFSQYGAYFQSLIIRERCMGFGDQGLIYFLIRRGAWFCGAHLYCEAERLWSRAMSMEVKVCESEVKTQRFGHSEGLQKDLEKDLSQYAYGVWEMVHNRYRPDFCRYLEFGFKELEILQLLNTIQSETSEFFVDTEMILGIMLYIFLSWLHYQSQACLSDELFQPSAECKALGCRLVEKHLYSKGSSLLHLSLTDFNVMEDEHVLDRYPNTGPLVNALLHWGAEEAVDTLDSSGNRPIHLAVRLADSISAKEDSCSHNITELLTPLMSGGAHLDAVDGSGRSALQLSGSEQVRALLLAGGPMPLMCQAACCVVREGVAYHCLGLPQHIVNFIQLHATPSNT